MILRLTFAAIFVVGQVTNVAIVLAVEQLSEPTSLALFFALFAAVVIGGWRLAVRLTDRLLGPVQDDRMTQRIAGDDAE